MSLHPTTAANLTRLYAAQFDGGAWVSIRKEIEAKRTLWDRLRGMPVRLDQVDGVQRHWSKFTPSETGIVCASVAFTVTPGTYVAAAMRRRAKDKNPVDVVPIVRTIIGTRDGPTSTIIVTPGVHFS